MSILNIIKNFIISIFQSNKHSKQTVPTLIKPKLIKPDLYNLKIIYNVNSYASMFAAILKRNEVLQIEGVRPVVVGYDRTEYNYATVFHTPNVIVLGVELKREHLENELEKANGKVSIFAQPNTYEYLGTDSRIIASKTMDDWRFTVVPHDNLVTQLRVIFKDIVDFENISTDMSMMSVLNAFMNLEAIKTICVKNVDIPLWYAGEDADESSERIKKAKLNYFSSIEESKKLVQRSFFHQQYHIRASKVSDHGYVTVPTVNIQEPKYLIAARFVSMCHKSFITYEDLKTTRVLKIVNVLPVRAASFVKYLNPIDWWFEGNTLRFTMPIPQLRGD